MLRVWCCVEQAASLCAPAYVLPFSSSACSSSPKRCSCGEASTLSVLATKAATCREWEGAGGRMGAQGAAAAGGSGGGAAAGVCANATACVLPAARPLKACAGGRASLSAARNHNYAHLLPQAVRHSKTGPLAVAFFLLLLLQFGRHLPPRRARRAAVSANAKWRAPVRAARFLMYARQCSKPTGQFSASLGVMLRMLCNSCTARNTGFRATWRC